MLMSECRRQPIGHVEIDLLAMVYATCAHRTPAKKKLKFHLVAILFSCDIRISPSLLLAE